MAFDEGLTQRVREVLEEYTDVDDKKMIGGVCYLLNGKMACGILPERMNDQ